MKRYLITLFIMLLGLVATAEEVYEFNQGGDYIFISEKSVKAVKCNNPEMISAQRVMTYMGNESQLIFSPKQLGKAKIQITTDKDVEEYSINILKSGAKTNSVFLELDFPTGLEQ